jgi:putative aldouronate transport system permease protein
MPFYKESVSRRVFFVVNYSVLTIATVVCIFPMLHVVAMSFSSKAAVNGGMVVAWPVNFTTATYQFVLKEPKFYNSFLISVERTLIGIVVNMLLTILAAYPLSMRKDKFHARGFYAWFFMVTMLFGGGMIPTYLVVYNTHLINSIWALIIPSAVPVFNVILLQNFFKELPDEISEAAFIDGAGYWMTLTRILVPISKPVMATLILFVAVGHWNSWFDGMIYMNDPNKYPLQTYLQTIVVQIDMKAVTNLSDVANIATKNSKAAQIVVAMLPILCVYPFLQKYFTKGIIMGSVKG